MESKCKYYYCPTLIGIENAVKAAIKEVFNFEVKGPCSIQADGLKREFCDPLAYVPTRFLTSSQRKEIEKKLGSYTNCPTYKLVEAGVWVIEGDSFRVNLDKLEIGRKILSYNEI